MWTLTWPDSLHTRRKDWTRSRLFHKYMLFAGWEVRITVFHYTDRP